MIYTNRKVTVRNGASTIDAPTILCLGEVDIEDTNLPNVGINLN